MCATTAKAAPALIFCGFMLIMLVWGAIHFYQKDNKERILFLYLRDCKDTEPDEGVDDYFASQSQSKKIDFKTAFAAHRGAGAELINCII